MISTHHNVNVININTYHLFIDDWTHARSRVQTTIIFKQIMVSK